MATSTVWAESLLDEASAIVEAEWIRLQLDEALGERELAGPFAELLAPRPGAPRVGVTTTTPRCPGSSEPARGGRWRMRRWPVTPVRPTQRAPPSPPGHLLEKCSRTKEVVRPPMIISSQRLLCRPH